MACENGDVAAIWVSFDGGTLWEIVPSLVEMSMSGSVGESEKTTKASARVRGKRAFTPTLGDDTASANFRLDLDDQVLLEMLSRHDGKSGNSKKYLMRIEPIVNTPGKRRWVAETYTTSREVGMPLDDAETSDLSFRLNDMAYEDIPAEA